MVPLVQGLLRASYALDAEDDFRTAVQGKGAAYAASVLPLVDGCNSGNANLVRDDLMPGKATGGSFQVVKAALERSYDCLGITCSDVGGILNVRRDDYLTDAEACDNVRPVGSNNSPDDKVVEEDQKEKEEDDGNLYENDYSMGDQPNSSDSDSDDFLGLDAKNAFLTSGLIFGFVGLLLGAGIFATCKNSSSKAKKTPEVEFVASSNTRAIVDEDDAI